MKYIGSNYTISRSIKLGVNFRIGTGSGFEHAGGTPLPISKASTPPPPETAVNARLNTEGLKG